MKKTLNRPPSKRKWQRLRAVVISSHYDEHEHEHEPNSFQAATNLKTGKPVNWQKHIDAETTYKVSYIYEGNSYTGEIGGYTVNHGKAIIYCNKKDPKIIKEFYPNMAWTGDTAIANLFIGTLLLFFEIIAFIWIVIPIFTK